MDIDKIHEKHRDSAALPDPYDIAKGQEFGVSVPLEGKMYDVSTFEDDQGLWVVKTLKPEIANSRFYPHMEQEEIFDQHIEDHERYLDYLEEFVSPSVFYKEIDTEGNVYFCRVDRYINAGIQYKEARNTDRKVPEQQLPEIGQRVRFVQGVADLVDSFGNIYRIPDLDFFIESRKGERNIVLFDTGYFTYEHNEGKDRRNFSYNLVNFLFTEEDLQRQDVKQAVQSLYGR